MPPIALTSTTGTHVDLSDLSGWVVLAVYPRTGVPGRPPIDPDWDLIPGARGCTPQLLGYQALYQSFRDRQCMMFGLSVQSTDYQREMAQRLGLQFTVLSDAGLRLTHALKLPTQVIAGQVLLKRMSLLILDGTVRHVEYPVFPPDQNANKTLQALAALQKANAGV
jgi:peroxiredoxin